MYTVQEFGKVIYENEKWIVSWAFDSGRPIRRVAFYDRSSGPGQQAKNNVRWASSQDAIEVARIFEWELVPSLANPNGQGCFLDTCSRTDTGPERRQELYKILLDHNIDTVAVFRYDRWCAGFTAANILDHLLMINHKNLILVEERGFYEIEQKLLMDLTMLYRSTPGPQT
jgi:hypothetical protein